MPPKPKKGKGGKKPKPKAKVPLDDINTIVITRAQLEEYCVRVHEEFTKEKQYSEFLRLDRDKLENMVAISREQLKGIRDVIRAKDRDMVECKERHRQLLEETRQKVTALVRDKRVDCLDINAWAMGKLGIGRRDHAERVDLLSSDIKHLIRQRREAEMYGLKRRETQEAKHAEDIWKTREDDKKLQETAETAREKSAILVTNALRQRFAEEYKRLEQIKNKQIDRFMRKNVMLTTDLKHYYDKLVHHNKTVMDELKTCWEEMKKSSAKVDKEYSKLIKENTELHESLKGSKRDEKELRGKLASSRDDQTELKQTKEKLNNANVTLDNYTWELEVLKITFDEQEKLRQENLARDTEVSTKARVEIEECILMLEFIVTHLHYRMREADSILKKIKFVYRQKDKWHPSLEDIDSGEDTELGEVTYGLTAVAEKRQHALDAYKALLREHHIHVDNTGFQTLSVDDILKAARHLRVLVKGDL